jgi:threonine synthase
VRFTDARADCAVDWIALREEQRTMNLASLECIACRSRFSVDEPRYRCANCGDLLDVVYDYPSCDPNELKQTWHMRRLSDDVIDVSGVWRYRELIPFFRDRGNIVTYPEGNTPLLDAPKSARYAGLDRLQVKHQGFNPTGSFKDNGMTTGVTQARALGMKAVLCASTGNTSAAMAAYASRAGLLGIVLVPDGQIAFAKLSQSLEYGALTLQIAGDFDMAMKLVGEVASDVGIYVLNSLNPFRLEGQKTIMVEMLQQRAWNVPDRVVVPGGNLGNSSSFGKAFKEMFDIGLIDRMPKVTIVQAEGAAPLYHTITSSTPDRLVTVHAKTLATAIKVGEPVSWKKAKRAMEWTNGWVTEVGEQAIADAKAIIGQDGIGCEPASATTLAGIKQLVERGTDEAVGHDEDVVAILTGHVLKDPDYTVRYHLGELYADYVTETTVTHRSEQITSSHPNQPIKVAATRAAVVDAIRREASRRGVDLGA